MDTDRLLAICAGLGLPQEDKEDRSGAIVGYAKGEFCLDSLKDLQRFLRRDDPYKRDVFKLICKWNTVSKDLIPIIEFHQNERNLVINSVKILVFLTMPVDPNSHDIAQQIEYLWELKSSLARNVTIAIIVSLLEDPLDHLENDTFTEEDWKLVQLILTLFRNLLSIQHLTLHQKARGSATKYLQLADRFLEILFEENVMDVVLVLTQHLEENAGFVRNDNLLLLEIVCCVLVGRDPELVAKSGMKGNKDGEVSSNVDSLKSLMEKEAKKRREIGQRNLERHSQFSGTFTRFMMDGSKTLHKGKPNLGPDESLLKVHKVQRGPQKRVAWDRQLIAPSQENLLEALKNFLEQFLSGGYNVLMQSVRNDIRKEHVSIQNSDINTFFQVVQFILAFRYHHVSLSKKNEGTSENLSICGPVAETVNEEMFKLVINRWQEIFEGIKQTNDYKSLSTTGSLLKHMIFMIDLVLKMDQENSRETHTSRVLLYKLFYDQTEQGLTHFVLTLFKSFDMHKQTKSDLADLLEIIHVIFRLMESLQQRGTLRVAKKARRIRKKKIPKIPSEATVTNPTEPSRSSESPSVGPTEPSRNSESQPDPTVDPTEPSGISENQPDQADNPTEPSRNSESQPDPTVVPTEPSRNSESQPDPALEAEQAVDPTEPSRNSQNQPDPTIDTTDPSRNSESQPNPSIDPTEPSRNSENHIAPTIDPTEPSRTPESDPSLFPTDPLLGPEQETADPSSSDSDEPPAVSESDFNVTRLVTGFVSNTTVHNLCWLLRHYKSNSVRTNHYVVCMLRRICEELGMSAMLYQLSLLTTFYEILSEQKSAKSKEHSALVNFLSKLVRDMMKLFAKQPLLFVKILFWKTRRECHCISADALISDAVKMRNNLNNNDNGGNNDNGDSNNGHEFGFSNKSIGDLLGDDEADLVPNYGEFQREDNISDRINENEGEKSEKKTNKRRRLKSFSNNEEQNDEKSDSIPNLDLPNTKVAKRRRSSIFSPLQENLIKDLFEKHKEDRKCCRIIAEALDPNGNISPAQISRKLKQLGLRNIAKRKKNDEMASPVSLSTDNDDDEPLQSLITRCKRGKEVLNEKSGINEMNLDSDNETLGSVFKKKSEKGKEALNEKSQIDEINEELDSDNEPLGSIFSQRKKSKKQTDVSLEKFQINEELDSDDEPLGSIFRNKSKSQVHTKSPVKKFSLEPINLEKEPEQILKESDGPDLLDDVIDSDREKNLLEDSDQEKTNSEKNLLEDSDDEETNREKNLLEDSDDETGSTVQRSSGSKRSLRMVLDFDDDDEF